MFLVTGANGNAGGAVVRALVANGHGVRALVRKAQRTWPAGVEPVAGDLNQPESLRAALAGTRAVFLLSGYDQLAVTLDEMRRAGVERVVLLSSSAAPSGDTSNAVARYHILSEQAVRESGLGWTFIQPNSFMSNTLRWLPQLRCGQRRSLAVRERPESPRSIPTISGPSPPKRSLRKITRAVRIV